MNIFKILYDILAELLPLPERRDSGTALRSRILAARSERSAERARLLRSIGHPEREVPTATGTACVLSKRQERLWAQYRQMVEDNDCLTRLEDDTMIDMGV